MIRRLALILALLLGCLTPSLAVRPDEVLGDPVLEARARTLSAELRCLVCQNQSIDDSAAPLARDLRLLVRERLKAGDSDAAVKAYLVARYGDFVLLKPPFDAQTLLLWLMPAGILGAGLIGILASRRGARKRQEPLPLDAVEQSRLDALTGRPDPSST
jgi:cytochrome c-type biogenesis protein CcmH